MDAAGRRRVRERAGQRREYCLLPRSAAPFLRFHIEHILAQQHVRDNRPENLCLACPHCYLHKGPNVASIDPESGEIVALFHPRTQAWSDHFELDGARIKGRTATGRATVRLLRMNDHEQLLIRSSLIADGGF